jgi:hypothetical protein
MKVKQEILDRVNNTEKRVLIAQELKVGEQMVQSHMRRNANNGRMTKMDFLQAISKVSGVPVDEILEQGEVVKEPQS